MAQNLSYLNIFIRLVIALVLGGAIGLQREYTHHAAGFRTHILVCEGACLYMLVGAYGFNYNPNGSAIPDRIAAQAVSGIGFIGSGAILKQGPTIKGLTTAASLWITVSIGLAVGVDFWFGAVLTTLFALIALEGFRRLEALILTFFNVRDIIVQGIRRKKVPKLIDSLSRKIRCKIMSVFVDYSVAFPKRHDAHVKVKLETSTTKSRIVSQLYTDHFYNVIIDGEEFYRQVEEGLESL